MRRQILQRMHICRRHVRDLTQIEEKRKVKRAIESGPEPGKMALILRFVSSSIQQLRHAKGLLEDPPCHDEFRDIQVVFSTSCA